LNALADGTKETLRAQLECAWRQTGRQPRQLAEAATIPVHGAHVWDWFIQLHNGRGSNGMEASKITAHDVKNWMWFNGIPSLELWEKRAISELDNAYFMSKAK
jgi:hypothetical protein